MTTQQELDLRVLALEKAYLLSQNYTAQDLLAKTEMIYQWLIKDIK